jgi:hypothetical protein
MHKIESSILISTTSNEHQSNQGPIDKILTGYVNEKRGLYLTSYLIVKRKCYNNTCELLLKFQLTGAPAVQKHFSFG